MSVSRMHTQQQSSRLFAVGLLGYSVVVLLIALLGRDALSEAQLGRWIAIAAVALAPLLFWSAWRWYRHLDEAQARRFGESVIIALFGASLLEFVVVLAAAGGWLDGGAAALYRAWHGTLALLLWYVVFKALHARAR